MRRRLLLVALALVTLGASMLVSPTPAGASTLTKSAWWYKARTGDPGTAVPPGAGPLPASPTAPPPPTPGPPTVPDGSVLVEGSASGADAIAAMTFTLTSTESAPTLTITPSASSNVPADAVVLACRAAVEWTAPDQNPGAWEEKPLVSCDQSVQGIAADDGTITFALAPLCQACTSLDVVLVPGTSASPAAAPDPAPSTLGSTFSLSFDAKQGAKLVTSEGSTTPSFSDSSSYASASPSMGSTYSTPSYSTPSAMATPVPIAQPALEPQEQAPTVPQQAALPVATAKAADKTGRGVAFLVLLAGLAFAGLAYMTPARAEDGTIGLGRFQRPVPAAARADAVEPVNGGLGRFARPRSGPPPALS